MAETQESPQNPNNGTLNPVYHSWQIQYSRFIRFPSLSSTSPALRPISSRYLKKRSPGTWLSSSASSMASLLLKTDYKTGAIVLTVSLRGKFYEEHYISRLIFSWPQVSCLEDCPVRGSRVVFASYFDSFGQVQKFAMRFSSASESQSSVHSLKEYMKGAIYVGNTESIFEPNVASSTENLSSHVTYLRPDVELSNEKSMGNKRPSVPSSFPAPFESCAKAKGPKDAEILYLNNLGKAMSSLPESSFNEMLMTLEVVIADLGGDLAL